MSEAPTDGEGTNGIQVPDYLQSIYKLVPAEITAAYLFIYAALNPLSTVSEDLETYFLIGIILAIFILGMVNYFAFPKIRKIEHKGVRAYVSLTFVVWVFGVSVDYWSTLANAHDVNFITPAIVSVLIALWSVASALLIKDRWLNAISQTE